MGSGIKVEVKNGRLLIDAPLDEAGSRSASGKTLVHASTHGNKQTDAILNGKPLVLGLNAYTK